MKPLMLKQPPAVAAAVIASLAIAGIMFAEHRRSNTAELDNRKVPASSAEKEEEAAQQLDPSKCNVVEGQWVFKNSSSPSYTEQTCPYLERQVTCVSNGRPDSDYLYWEWQPDGCALPRFDAERALEKLRGKRLMFVGDSLGQAHWMSFMCLLQSVIPEEDKSMARLSRALSVFTAKKYNTSVEFYWAPFLVESNTDADVITDTNRRVLHVDAIAKHAQHWTGVDILVFDTYVWWMSGHRIKSVWGSFPNGDEGYEELDAWIAYRLGLKTWANWVDTSVNPNASRVFFTTMSPGHMNSADWRRDGGIACYNETKPIMKKGYWGSGSNLEMMEVLSSIVARMRVPVTFLNITQLSEYRVDGHLSVYTEYDGRMLDEEQRANPKQYADCIHWCLPGVPDTWSQILYAYL